MKDFYLLTTNKDLVRALFDHRHDFILGKEYFEPIKIEGHTFVTIDKGQKADKWILKVPVSWTDKVFKSIEFSSFYSLVKIK